MEKKKKAEIRDPSEPCEPVTVHRPGRSDRGPDGSMLFSHGTVPYLKWTVNLNGSRVFRSDLMVRSRFNNLDLTIIPKSTSKKLRVTPSYVPSSIARAATRALISIA